MAYVALGPVGSGSSSTRPAQLERALDLDEVRGMLDAGESQIAIDELRWLLDDCHEFLAAHRLLGELALAEEDLKLARGHFGIAFQLGVQAAKDAKGTLPYAREANRDFLESGKGLAWCLKQAGKAEMARDVVEQMLRFDPSDPLNVRSLGEVYALDVRLRRGALAWRPHAERGDEVLGYVDFACHFD